MDDSHVNSVLRPQNYLGKKIGNQTKYGVWDCQYFFCMQELIFIGELKDQSAFSSKRDAVGHDENRLFANRAGLGRAVDAKMELSQLKGRTPDDFDSALYATSHGRFRAVCPSWRSERVTRFPRTS
ncbi:MAG TPA: hypothetical protein VK608_11630 [Edaphobacter sp.]|nr:hypothetical protein [Edaphobacter sp.]